jgi:hypothetical protein
MIDAVVLSGTMTVECMNKGNSYPTLRKEEKQPNEVQRK